jgi:hypothetical protein
MARKQRTPEVLCSASGHLYYEFNMFFSLGQTMMSGVLGKGPLHDAVLESLTVHARALLDFLYATEKPRPDDVIAEDYFDEPSRWREIRPQMTATLTMARERVGKEVAHLTYARLEGTPEDKQWPVAQIAEDINIALAAFLEHVSKDRLSPIWESVKIAR